MCHSWIEGITASVWIGFGEGSCTGLGYRIGGTHLLAGREAFIPEASPSTFFVEETIGDLPQR
ncbi:hypothetical protein [Paenibacillus fonticola]|uniref:hypothetical protein n=1 Tax=Paenibacillus fonticola TaxID=379896 RepID=UPI0003744F36|nr:hypothetical protein [Paenibacillus fonticola]